MRFEIGDKVRFTGCSNSQAQFGNCDDPRDALVFDAEYVVSSVEVHNWHTKIRLAGKEGRFNSVCFEVVK